MENNSENIEKRRVEFKVFLQNIFKSVMKDEDINRILTPKPLEMFEIAFTHRFVSDKNYEVYEKIGDKILAACFAMYLRRRFPKRTDPEFFNLVETFFCAKPKLKELSMKLGLPKFLINPTLSTTNRTDKEDLFESFIGVTSVICDEFITMHFGYGVAYELLSKIYDEEEIDPNNILKYKPYVGQLKEIYDVNNWGDVMYHDNDKRKAADQPYTVVVVRDGVHFGRGESLSKKIAREEAARKTMEMLGIDMDKVIEIRENKMVDEDTKPLIDESKKIINRAGLKGLRHKKRNAAGKIEVFIQSQTSDGTWKLISSGKGPDERDAYIAALDEFIKINSTQSKSNGSPPNIKFIKDETIDEDNKDYYYEETQKVRYPRNDNNNFKRFTKQNFYLDTDPYSVKYNKPYHSSSSYKYSSNIDRDYATHYHNNKYIDHHRIKHNTFNYKDRVGQSQQNYINNRTYSSSYSKHYDDEDYYDYDSNYQEKDYLNNNNYYSRYPQSSTHYKLKTNPSSKEPKTYFRKKEAVLIQKSKIPQPGTTNKYNDSDNENTRTPDYTPPATPTLSPTQSPRQSPRKKWADEIDEMDDINKVNN